MMEHLAAVNNRAMYTSLSITYRQEFLQVMYLELHCKATGYAQFLLY